MLALLHVLFSHLDGTEAAHLVRFGVQNRVFGPCLGCH
jgi:hypothetical protein